MSNDSHETEVANLLINDLQSNGATVITENQDVSDEDLTPSLESELAGCQYLILVQTPAACRSWRVQAVAQAALSVLGQQRILRLIAIPSDDAPSLWKELRTFDASQDYPRIREKVFLELGLVSLDPNASLLLASPLILSAASQATQPTQPGNPGVAFTSAPPSFSNLDYDTPTAPVSSPPFIASTAMDKQAIDRPPSLPLRSHPFFRWGFIAIFSLATLVVLLASLSFVYGRSLAPTPPAPPGAGRTATPQPMMHILAQDTFQRLDQQGWGTASDGHAWGADAANGPVFSIRQDRGVITDGRGALNATLGPQVMDAEVFFTGSINVFNQANLGAILRWANADTFYKAYIDGQQLILLKSVNGQMTHLVSVPFRAFAHTFYDLRFRAQGTTLFARAWPQNAPEPAQWMITAQDATLQTGLGGLRVFAEPANIFTITAFQETTIS